MKGSRRSTRAERGGPPASRAAEVLPPLKRSGPKVWPYLLGAFLLVFLAFEIYQPAIRGPFLFDDRYLPFFESEFANAPLRSWIAGVRPALMLSYWLNFQLVQTEPYWYHVTNVFFQAANAVFVALIV